ncbi:MAG: IS1595 family transposase, partial [Roseovarius sp.]|nr:IS1595 family transposase [Roseovarius sp.]
MPNGPGKSHRKGLDLLELQDMFPNEQVATEWFEEVRWPNGRCCPRCGSTSTKIAKPSYNMPYLCNSCKKGFSVKYGTALQKSNISLRKWAIAIYLEMTSLKSVSSMKLHRDIGVTQKTAWFMLHRIRDAFVTEKAEAFDGPVEVDETYFGGKRRNMKKSKREKMTGRGAVGKTAVVGAKDRKSNQVTAQVVQSTDSETLHGFVEKVTDPDATVYTDSAKAYIGINRKHESVNHGIGEYVRDQAHTNGIESFWAMLKRAHKGTYHQISAKHLNRYVHQFAAKHNLREENTIEQMESVFARMVGKRIMYKDLVADAEA